ncbi:uncharacterized protein Bfra_009595 [Botrytis fragariae]|uniref:Uncharacterized protein n=1 Tax=Botrytis fragariae TaxID=1964551 RepID=A0A8H6APD7_9HELO|nr:uncharacterized protein Bfra_009595 [Botrytis fragariae]KAF5871039.1 hypothetical protein Bfra_009595 [Botrytis fragariae]
MDFLTDQWIHQPPWNLNEYLPETLQHARQLGKGACLEIYHRICMQQESYTIRSDPPSRQLLMLTEGFKE